MIELKELAKNIETGLNENLQGFTFKIHSDTGKFQKSIRKNNTVTEITNGLLTLTSSDVSNLTDGSLFAVNTCRFDVITKLIDTENSVEKESPNLFDITACDTEDGEGYFDYVEKGEPNKDYTLILPSGDYTFSAKTTENISVVINGAEQEITARDEENGVKSVSFYLERKSFITLKFYGAETDFNDVMVNKGVYVPFMEFGAYELLVQGNIDKVNALRTAIETLFQAQKQEIMEDSDGKVYNVTTLFNFINTGMRDQVQILGDSFTLRANVLYMFVENGMNTANVKYYLDGILLPFQANTVSRVATMDGNVYSGSNGAVKNLASQTSFSVAFELPALNTAITQALFEFLFVGDLNTAHIMSVKNEILETTHNYLMGISTINADGETLKNIGQKVTFVEIPDVYELINIPDDYYIYEVEDAPIDVSLPTTAYAIGVFGDSLKAIYFSPENTTSATVIPLSEGDIVISTGALQVYAEPGEDVFGELVLLKSPTEN